MRHIAQILTDGGRIAGGRLFDTITDIREADNRQPLLIIGYEQAKSLIDGFSPLRKKYANDVYWTFGRHENRTQQEWDIKEFCRASVHALTRHVDYRYVDINALPTNRIKRLLEYFSAPRNFYCCTSYDCHDQPSFVHVFDMEVPRVFGISISTLVNFHNVRLSSIIKWLDNHPNLKRKERNFAIGREARWLVGFDTMTDLVLWTLMTKCTDCEFDRYMDARKRNSDH